MPPRRSSTRSSQPNGEIDIQIVGGAATSHSGMSAKKRGVESGQISFNPMMDDKKRRKKETQKPTFKPQPVLHSSDTPPEEEDFTEDLPPPPSEKKIARRRESTRAIRERAELSPSRTVPKPAKRQKTMTSSVDPIQAEDEYPFGGSSKPRVSAPRPSSPPQHVHSRFLNSRQSLVGQGTSSTGSGGTMGPPTGLVRKTRKSMRAIDIPSLEDDSMDSMVPLPESETPMIRKNRELREAQSRRSSLSGRGQRASSSLGRGEISIPHSSVDSKLFYTHLGSDMPEPIRARHVIAWCAKRASDEETGKKSKTKSKERTTEGDKLINEIMDEVIMSLGKGNVDTNVFANVATSSSSLIRPHPRNTVNRETKAKEEAIIERCRKETSQWTSLVNATIRRREATHRAAVLKRSTNEEPDLDGAGWMVDALDLADEILAEGDGDLTKMGDFDDVEFKVDSLLDSTHVAVQYSRQSQRFLDGIFTSLTADLRARETAGMSAGVSYNETDGPDSIAILSATTRSAASGSTSTGVSAAPPTRKDPMVMLRALASADSRLHNEEAVEAAARVTPVIPQSTTGLNVSVAPGVTATPRRVGQATPRRVQQSQQTQVQPTPRSASIAKRAELAE